MSKLERIVVGGLLACAFLWGQIVSPLWGQQKTEPSKPPAGSEEQQEMALDVRYAEAYLAAMKATLHRYEETNRVAPNTIRPTIIQGLQSAVRKGARTRSIGPRRLGRRFADLCFERRSRPASGRRVAAPREPPIPKRRNRSAMARSRG